MRIDVALTPGEAGTGRGAVCVVVDVLRASSSIVTLLDRGAATVIPVATVEEARRLARANGLLVAGEERSVTPADFDLGNRPAEIARADLGGRDVVFVSRNGTVVLGGLPDARAVLVGCLLNATACCQAALGLAQRDRPAGGAVRIVCAGRDGGFVMDDAVAAGELVERLAGLAAAGGGRLTLGDGAAAARRLRGSYPDPVSGLRDSASGRLVSRLGLEEDIDYSARTDLSRSVPVLVPAEPPRIERLDERLVETGRAPFAATRDD